MIDSYEERWNWDVRCCSVCSESTDWFRGWTGRPICPKCFDKHKLSQSVHRLDSIRQAARTSNLDVAMINLRDLDLVLRTLKEFVGLEK